MQDLHKIVLEVMLIKAWLQSHFTWKLKPTPACEWTCQAAKLGREGWRAAVAQITTRFTGKSDLLSINEHAAGSFKDQG
jgi:hypothetical protein